MRDLPEGWVETTLGEVIELIIDHRGKTPKKLGGDWAASGYRAISAKTIKNGILVNEEKMNILPENLYRKWMKVEVEYGDVFLTSEAPLGEHLIWKSDEKVVLSQRIYGIRTNKERLNPFYFNYFLDGDYFQHELKSRESGSTVTGIKQSELVKTKVILPPLPEQKAIADMLSSFDEKIELLREQNKTLETLAQTIFKEWFVHFNFPDPHGKPYRNNGGAMVASELGEIPQGWRVGKLGEVVDIFDSKRIPISSNERQKRQGIYPYYGATKAMDFIDDYIFDGTYLLMAEDGSVMDDQGYPFLQYVWGKFWVNNHTHILQGKNGFSTEALYVFLKKRKVASIVNGAVQLKINQKNLMSFDILIPANEVLQSFNEFLQPIFEKVKSNSSQTQTLSKTRDTLLPKLMSGQVRAGNQGQEGV